MTTKLNKPIARLTNLKWRMGNIVVVMDPNLTQPDRPMLRFYTIGTGKKREVYSLPILEAFNYAHKRGTL